MDLLGSLDDMQNWKKELQGKLPEFLQELEKEADESFVPVLAPETRGILKILLKLLKPRQILEIGTGTGFSALWFAWVCGPGTQITTMEMIEHRLEAVRRNFSSCDKYRQISLVPGDARELLQELDGTYDLIFLDAAKRYYPRFLPDCLRLLRPGGLLVADDIFFEGLVWRDELPHERRTMGRGLKEFLEKIIASPELDTHLVPWGQGMAVSLKNAEEGNR